MTAALPLRDYTFLGITQSLCPVCLAVVPAKILARESRVYFRKSCPTHGIREDFVCSDASQYDRMEFSVPGKVEVEPDRSETMVQRDWSEFRSTQSKTWEANSLRGNQGSNEPSGRPSSERMNHNPNTSQTIIGMDMAIQMPSFRKGKRRPSRFPFRDTTRYPA